MHISQAFLGSMADAAFVAAEDAFARNEVPVGAALAIENEIIAVAGNRVQEWRDPTAHAEMLVIRQACAMLGEKYLPDAVLYVTLEPCPMCAAAISFARLARLYFGAYDVKSGGVAHGTKMFDNAVCHFAPEWVGGIRAEESTRLLQRFFGDRRA